MIRLLRRLKSGLRSLVGLPWRLGKRVLSRLPWWTSPRAWIRRAWELLRRTYVRIREDAYFRLRMILFAGAAVLMLVTILSFAIPMSSNREFCGSCHSNTPSLTSMLESSHARLTCYACHEPASFLVILKVKLLAPKDIVKEALGRVPDPINPGSHLATELPSENCLRCHNMKNRKFSPRNGILMDHEKHVERGINCTRCHNRVAHIGKEGYPLWQTMMEGCFRCHQEGRVKYVSEGVVQFVEESELDENLHEAVREEEEHRAEEESHSIHNLLEEEGGAGHAARPFPRDGIALASTLGGKAEAAEHETEGVEHEAEEHDAEGTQHESEEGHDSEEAEHESEEEIKINEAPRSCNTCHPPDFNLRPRSHNSSNWAPKTMPVNIGKRTEWSHAKLAKDTTVVDCYQCHQKAFCLDCHGTDMPHEKPFFDRHGKVVLASLKELPKTVFFADYPFTFVSLQKTSVAVVKDSKDVFCYRCHTVNQFCQECHGISFPHPPKTWRKQHGKTAKGKLPSAFPVGEELRGKPGEEACWTCHREQFCNECHGGVKMPHDKERWLGNHVFFLKSHSTESCLNCHHKNECEACHSVHRVHIQQQLYDFSKVRVPGARR